MPPPSKNRPKRWLKGSHIQCIICPYVKEGKSVKYATFSWHLNNHFNYHTRNIVYMIECNIEHCKGRYIGETERSLKDRIAEHIGYIRTHRLDKSTGAHFNKPGHTSANMTATVIEKVRSNDIFYRKERESYYIRKFNTFHNGINLRP